MFERLADRLYDHRRGLSRTLLLSLIVPLFCLPRARLDNAVEVWFDTTGPDYRAYRDFQAKYGNDEFVLVAAEAEDPLADRLLRRQRELVAILSGNPDVAGATSLGSLAAEIGRLRSDPNAFLRRSPFVRNLWLGSDGHAYGLPIRLKPFAQPSQRRGALERIRAMLRGHALDPNAGVHLAGTPVLNAALDRGSQEAARTFLPLAVGVSLLLLGAVLRNLRACAAVLAAVTVTSAWTVALLIAAGRSFNLVTIVLPALLFVLSLSSGIHLAARFLALHRAGQDGDLALRRALHDVIRPIVLSHLTTAVGFAVLQLSAMTPVRDFGLFAALGVLIGLGASLAVIPGLLVAPGSRALRPVAPAPAQFPDAEHHWTEGPARWAARHPGTVVPLALGFVVGGTALALSVRVDSNILNFFPPDSRVRRDYDFVQRRLTGLYSVELDATAPAARGPALMRALETCERELVDRPHIAKVLHAASVPRFLKQVSGSVLLDTPRVGGATLRDLQGSFRHRDGDRLSLRLSCLVTAMGSADFETVVRDIRAAAAHSIAPVGSVRLTGVVPLLIRAQESLVRTQLQTLGIALVVILLLIGLFLRSVRALVVALLPNLLPVVGLFVVMVSAGIALDTATVMIAGIALGIAADDTLHVLSHLRREPGGAGPAAALGVCFGRIGRAITYTSVVAVAGFVLLLGAPFRPLQYFGLLGATAMILAWIGDVIVLPACGTLLRPWHLGGTPS